jgi:hypothetical protein
MFAVAMVSQLAIYPINKDLLTDYQVVISNSHYHRVHILTLHIV